MFVPVKAAGCLRMKCLHIMSEINHAWVILYFDFGFLINRGTVNIIDGMSKN